LVFTNHPGSDDLTVRPNWLAGNAILPRAVQHHNVTVCLHRVPADDPFPFSHAYFPFGEFDEVLHVGTWWLARSGDGFVGLWCSDQPTRLDPAELRSTCSVAAWVCEVADTTRYADLAAFAEALSTATIAWSGDHLEYASTQGRLEFSWDGPLLVDGSAVSVEDYPRSTRRTGGSRSASGCGL